MFEERDLFGDVSGCVFVDIIPPGNLGPSSIILSIADLFLEVVVGTTAGT